MSVLLGLCASIQMVLEHFSVWVAASKMLGNTIYIHWLDLEEVPRHLFINEVNLNEITSYCHSITILTTENY